MEQGSNKFYPFYNKNFPAYQWKTDVRRLAKLLTQYGRIIICYDNEIGEAWYERGYGWSFKTTDCYEKNDMKREEFINTFSNDADTIMYLDPTGAPSDEG